MFKEIIPEKLVGEYLKVLSQHLLSQVSDTVLSPLKTDKFQHFEVTNIVSTQSGVRAFLGFSSLSSYIMTLKNMKI